MILFILPPADYYWYIILKGKIIAIIGANCSIGLGIAEVYFANGAVLIYSFNFFELGKKFAVLVKKSLSCLCYFYCNVIEEVLIIEAIDTIII